MDIFERSREMFENGIEASRTQPGLGKDMPNPLTRYFGGHQRDNHPFVSGYWQFILDPPANILFKEKIAQDAMNWWHCTAEGFTPPTRTLNKADIPGQGGLGSSFVTGQTLTRTFTITFREYQEMPIFNLLELWTSIIDPYTGVSPLAGNEWVSKNYKGSAMVILTKPSISAEESIVSGPEIEEVFYFHGVFPESAPWDTLASDISTNDVIQHNVTFSFDGWPLTKKDEGVMEKAEIALSNSTYYENTYKRSLEDVKSQSSLRGIGMFAE